MSAESILITVATTAGGSTSFPVVLKKVMELPPPNILDGDDGTFGVGRGRTEAVTAVDNNDPRRRRFGNNLLSGVSVFVRSRAKPQLSQLPDPNCDGEAAFISSS